MSKYYKNQHTQTSVLYKKISNGVILTKFDEKTGIPFGNPEYQFFVSTEDLKDKWHEVDFKIDSSEAMNLILSAGLKDIVGQMINYGIAETQVHIFNEFEGSSPISCSVYRDLVRNDKATFKSFLTNDDDEFEFGEAEELFDFIQGGLIPIIKRMMVQVKEAQ